jgi:hypothetical protein
MVRTAKLRKQEKVRLRKINKDRKRELKRKKRMENKNDVKYHLKIIDNCLNEYLNGIDYNKLIPLKITAEVTV